MWSAWVRISLYALLFAALTLIVSAVEPFGIDDAIDKQSRDILYRAFAPAYDRFSTDTSQFQTDTKVIWSEKPAGVRPPREQIANIFVSENVIATNREKGEMGWESWRPSYFGHAGLVNTLSQLQANNPGPVDAAMSDGPWIKSPPAIFFDFIFLEIGENGQESSDFRTFKGAVAEATKYDAWRNSNCGDALKKLVCIKLAGGIPLIFAEAAGEVDAPAQVEIGNIAILAPVSYSGVKDAYPVVFPLRSEQGASGSHATPASLLYLAWCMDNTGGCAWLEPPGGTDRAGRLNHMVETYRSKMTEPLSLVWGSGVPDGFVALERGVYGRDPLVIKSGLLADEPVASPSRKAGEQPAPNTPTCRIDNDPEAVASLLVRTVLGKAVDGNLYQACPYHIEIPYSTMIDGFDAESAKRLLDGRLLVVGTRFQNSADWTASPVHGLVPGYQRHAMAIDNLLKYHNRYLEAPKTIFFKWDKQDLFQSVSQFIIFLVGGVGQFWLNRRLIAQDRKGLSAGKRPHHWIVYVTMTIAVFAISIGSVWVFIDVLRLEPPNWIGHIVFALGFFIYLMRDEFFDDVGSVIRGAKSAGTATLNFIQDWKRYFDLETLGFEDRGGPAEMKRAKEEIVERLYPPRQRPDIPRNRAVDIAPANPLKEGA